MKTALIGLGRIGWGFHLPELTKRGGFSPVIVVDTSVDRLAEAKQTYGVDGYTDYQEMLQKEKPELVVIASPTHLHKQHAIEAFHAGANVFLDKPMAVNIEEAREIADCAAACGRKLMIYQPHRVTAEAVVAKRVLESGLLGRVYMIKRANSGYNRRSDWQAFTKYGGGMLNNYGAHYIDQMLYLTGAQIADITCHRQRAVSLGDADDVVKVLMKTDENMTIDIDINQAAAFPITPWQIFGTLGAAIVEQTPEGGLQFTVKYLVPEELPPLEVSDALIAKGRKYSQDPPLPWHTQAFPIRSEDARSFYDACYAYYAEDKEPLVPVADTLRVMEIIDRCHQLTPDA
ncbi:MAG: Gfo/Idh/MocA family oxidoreductase [Clostridiaceae bacterium]|nr:Gfo/Idh/MocA family oxidoreductase [Clostridiaceae bacterium]